MQTIPLPEVKGRLDHMGVDLEKEPPVCRHRCKQFTCGCGPNWRRGVIKSLAGFKDSQDALFLGGDFNKLYVSSLDVDGHVRVFQGESFWLVQELRGMNVGILQPKPGTGYDRLVADMIATTPRPGHTTQCGKRSP